MQYVQDLWQAFPSGYLALRGTKTLGGYTVLHGKGGGALWFHPDGGVMLGQSSQGFEDARTSLLLLPDPEDPTTLLLLRMLLAERIGFISTTSSDGVGWYPKGSVIQDRSRNSSGKGFLGWQLKSSSGKTSKLFPIEERNGVKALLAALALGGK